MGYRGRVARCPFGSICGGLCRTTLRMLYGRRIELRLYARLATHGQTSVADRRNTAGVFRSGQNHSVVYRYCRGGITDAFGHAIHSLANSPIRSGFSRQPISLRVWDFYRVAGQVIDIALWWGESLPPIAAVLVWYCGGISGGGGSFDSGRCDLVSIEPAFRTRMVTSDTGGVSWCVLHLW